MVSRRKTRAQVWNEAQAHAELDGFVLPPVFVMQAERYAAGAASLDDMARCVDSLLPEDETLRLMIEQYEPDYVDLDPQEFKDIETIWEEQRQRQAK